MADYVLDATENAAFLLTGTGVGLTRTYLPLVPASGEFALTGSDVTLTYAREILAASGAFVVTGSATSGVATEIARFGARVGVAGGMARRARTTAGTPGVATKVAFAVQPGGAVDEVALTTQPVVEVRDAFNAVVTGSSATVHMGIVSGAGTLGGTVDVAASSGVATFTDLVVDGSGPIILRASTGGILPAQSNTFTVIGGGNALLLETGDFLLLETGDFLLLEA